MEQRFPTMRFGLLASSVTMSAGWLPPRLFVKSWDVLSPDLAAEFSDYPHIRGVASMARSDAPDSANSQFFIMLAPRFSLDHKYSAFGRVVEGMAAVDSIAVGEPPAEPTRIVRASIGGPLPAPPVIASAAPVATAPDAAAGPASDAAAAPAPVAETAAAEAAVTPAPASEPAAQEAPTPQ